MYAYISGKLVDMQEGAVVVDNQGIGYELFVSNTTLSQLPPVGQSVRLFVY
ncbi:MAG: Holliday junction branch migration protein RuvA, partial [Clostridia bacterium]|nr:Holliday junction branch migration protein RuvA [Clostridia bacterium]